MSQARQRNVYSGVSWTLSTVLSAEWSSRPVWGLQMENVMTQILDIFGTPVQFTISKYLLADMLIFFTSVWKSNTDPTP